MANVKISELTALVAPVAADELVIVDVSATSTKKTTVGEVVSIISGDVDVANNGIATISELPVSKLQDGTPRQLLQTDLGGTGVEWTSNVDVPGTLDVTGTATFDGSVNIVGAGSAGTTQAVSFNGSAPVDSLVLTSTGRIGIQTASPAFPFQVGATGAGGIAIDAANSAIQGTFGSGGNVVLRAQTTAIAGGGEIYLGGGTRGDGNVNAIVFSNANTERSRIDSSGRFLIGASSARANFYNGPDTAIFQIEGAFTGLTRFASFTYGRANSDGPIQIFAKHRSDGVGGTTIVSSGDEIGRLSFQGSDGTEFVEGARIEALVDGTPGANDMPGRLVFSTTSDGANSPTRRVVMRNNGWVVFGQDAENGDAVGIGMDTPNGTMYINSFDFTTLQVNRINTDGTLISFKQANIEEGSISVSGTTVSYNGAHLSRWSQLPGGVERTEILRGSVLCNIDEMCEWGEEENEQLNRMKVSDVEGDKNVSGVFQAWDDDDDTYTNDFYCAMTGDFIIRIAQGVTVERGDLLMSAGDGTAKPQDDDIIRNKTIAKVTSTNVTCTYDDGSYCVPCVLMAC